MSTPRRWNDSLTRISAERRNDPRVGVELIGAVSSYDLDYPLKVDIRDLSAGGACIVSSAPLGTQAINGLRLETDGSPLQLGAEGLWLEKRNDAHYTGLRFTDLDRKDESTLMHIVSEAARAIVEFVVFESALPTIGRGDALALANSSRFRTIEPGTWLYRQGAPSPDADCVFLVLDGQIRLERRFRHFNLTLVDLTRGGVFGGLPALGGMEPPESAIATETATLLELNPASISYLLEHSPWVMHRLTQAVVAGYASRIDGILEAQGTTAKI